MIAAVGRIIYYLQTYSVYVQGLCGLNNNGNCFTHSRTLQYNVSVSGGVEFNASG
jgi:hypothetical protein